ncbi:MAG: WYL domain-containing protein [Bacteroidota bacterium]
MPLSKNSFARYQVIDACLRNKQRRFPNINVLLEKCQERLDRSISRSTIEKDLRAMKDLPEPGYYAPIAFDKENNGYYYTDPSYSINNIQVKDEDIDAIEMAATMLSRYREFHVVKRYAEAIDRILDVVNVRRILSKDEFEQYVQLEKPVYTRGADYIEPVIRSIQDKTVLRIAHQPFSESHPQTRTVHPYLLKEHNGRWYLVGLDETENDIRTFGLERILSIGQEPGLKFRQVKFNAREYFKYTVGVIAPQSKPPKIQLECSKQQAQYLITKPMHESQVVIREKKDSVVFGFEVHPTWEFIAMILGFREGATVISPGWFREQMRDIIVAMEKNYS